MAGNARSMRSESAMSSVAPESSRPYRISSATHQALKHTATAPMEVTAANDTTHSG